MNSIKWFLFADQEAHSDYFSNQKRKKPWICILPGKCLYNNDDIYTIWKEKKYYLLNLTNMIGFNFSML